MTSGNGFLPAGFSINAHADKGGNGGGNGGGGGSAGGKSSKASNGHGHKFGGQSRSTASIKRNSTKRGGHGSGRARNLGDFFGGVAGAARSALGLGHRTAKSESRSPGKLRGNGPATSNRPLAQKPIPVPQPRPADQPNFHAKLAGLNSLNRNYHAYLNANDPKMAAIQDYVLASVEYEIAAEDLEALQIELAAAAAAFAARLSGIEPYDGFSYEDLAVEELQARLDVLQTLDTTGLSNEEIAILEAERQDLEAALASSELAALQSAEAEVIELETDLTELQGAVTNEALEDALLAGANPNRVEQYGAEDYVDQEMLDWAKDLLGVGDAHGKIDEVRAVLESGETLTDEEIAASE
ncbi:hypothetical protein [Chelativorans salis]|uniref:Uncharacterized protein n=1 Tax=Chelativorans salis TaxID=2978478 RepID=A0ABT2LVA7_9HYPH|nr:hypothetical protein [Chelativorans sp. EGI FJ00035]MCT7378444.1 hypothetical protein [Chelativorans sp. EGI FJ00035]